MRAIFESIFDIVYLITVITIGIFMIVKGRKNKQYLLFGIMAVVLGGGDSFHLIPRVISLISGNEEAFLVPLGVGKAITSVTMTGFYILLYYVYRIRYNIKGEKYIHISLYLLSVLRIVLCLLPQNEWTSAEPPLYMGIIRNIPFLIIGIIIIVLFFIQARKNNDKSFRFMYLTIVLSFGFYIPVVLVSHLYPMVGLLMIPKTCAYVWTVVIGLVDMLKSMKEAKTKTLEEKINK